MRFITVEEGLDNQATVARPGRNGVAIKKLIEMPNTSRMHRCYKGLPVTRYAKFEERSDHTTTRLQATRRLGKIDEAFFVRDVGEDREKCHHVCRTVRARDRDVFHQSKVPVIPSRQSSGSLDKPRNNVRSDVTDTLQGRQLTRQSTAAAPDVDQKMPVGQSKRTHEMIFELADSLKLPADRQPQRLSFPNPNDCSSWLT